jgi:putative oxidoreductase
MCWSLEREALGMFVTPAEPAAAMNNLRCRSHLHSGGDTASSCTGGYPSKDTIAMIPPATPDVGNGNRTAAVSIARDFVLLLARIGLGALMVAHAKLEYDFAAGSITGVGVLFEESGIPLAAITGPANVLFEFVGGAAMILGLAVRVVAVLMALNMMGAWTFVHTGGLYALDHTGPELVIALGLLSLVLAVAGSGRLGLDHLIVRRVIRGRASSDRSTYTDGSNEFRLESGLTA